MAVKFGAPIDGLFDSDFSGRIIQVTEALDPGDAVSNQIVDMDRLFRQMGFVSLILSTHHHPAVGAFRQNLDSVQVTEKDIVIFHFCGFTDRAGPWVLEQYCTRVMFYHNITPHHFFEEGSQLHYFCRKGREQLKEIVPQFHVHWGASAYNLEELHAAGADPAKSVVIPIIVPDAPPRSAIARPRDQGHWLFVGRIVSNKGQLDLIDLFASARRANPAMAQKLTFVGRYDSADNYYQLIRAKIDELDLVDHVVLTGKISDSEREASFDTSQFYISISEHEGFGVPLVEAPLRGLPVLALDRAAAGETTGGHGLSDDVPTLVASIEAVFRDPAAYAQLVEAQRNNAARFSEASVDAILRDALAALLPKRGHYKTVSVVICTYNRLDHLKRCLDYLRYQSNPNFEVVVVDGPSTDGTKAFLAAYGNGIRVAEIAERNLSVSRNVGIENAAGDIVAFIDDDGIAFDTWIDSILRAYNERPLTIAALGGPVFFAGTLKFQSEDISVDTHARTRDGITSQDLGKDGQYRALLGTNSTFVRDAVIAYGGFDEQFDYFLDESELCLRLQLQGHLIGYSTDIIVRHEFAQSHNRRGKYDYDWRTICKNITYFVAAYSGLNGGELRAFLENRLEVERVNPLRAAMANGELSAEACEKGIKSVWAGLDQGLADVAYFPRTRKISTTRHLLSPFALAHNYLAVGRDRRALHVCIISKEAPPFTQAGGIGTLYYHLISELLLMGHHVTLILPGAQDEIIAQGPFVRCHTRVHDGAWHGLDQRVANNVSWSLGAFATLAKLHSEHPVDVVDSALWDSEALAVSMLDQGQRPPLVVRLVTPFQIAADMNEWDIPTIAGDMIIAAEKALIENADAVLPISRSIAQTIQKCHDLQEGATWHDAPCGITYWPLFDVRENYAELEQIGNFSTTGQEDEKIILFIGRLERRKGVDILFEALPAILSGDPTARIVIAGTDSEGWERQIVKALPRAMTSRIYFLGNVSDAVRDKLLAHAHCLVFPSRYESFGLVPLEAFVHGVPVVASRSGAIPEVVLDGQCGLLFVQDDSAALASAVIRILGDDALHQRLSEGAIRRVRELSARNSAIRTCEIYSKLLPTELIEA